MREEVVHLAQVGMRAGWQFQEPPCELALAVVVYSKCVVTELPWPIELVRSKRTISFSNHGLNVQLLSHKMGFG